MNIDKSSEEKRAVQLLIEICVELFSQWFGELILLHSLHQRFYLFRIEKIHIIIESNPFKQILYICSSDCFVGIESTHLLKFYVVNIG